MAFNIAFVGFVPEDNDGTPYRYLALECLTASVRKLGLDIECQSWVVREQEIHEKAEEVVACHPSVIAISMPIGTFHYVKTFRSLIRESCQDAQVIIGNLTTTLAPQIVLDAFPDAWLIRGEGEDAFSEAIRFLYEGNKGCPHWIEGLCGAGYISEVVRKESRFGGYDTSLWKDIFSYNGAALTEASRGCIGNCTFCSTKRMHPCGWIPKPIPAILDELYALSAHDVSWVFFIDDDFIGPDWPRAIELSQQIHKALPNMTFGSSFRAASFLSEQNVKNLGILVENGLRSMLIGAESFSSTQLRRFGKSTVEKNIAAIHHIEKYQEIELTIGFLIDPLITLEEFRDSIGTLLSEGYTSYINDPFRLLDIHLGTEYEKMARQAQVIDSFSEEEMKYNWHFLDERMNGIQKEMELYRQVFGKKEKRIRNQYREVTRSAVRQETDLRYTLKQKLNEIKRLKCKYLFELACHNISSAQMTMQQIRCIESDEP